jgi:uncharacterized OsmC-like protein
VKTAAESRINGLDMAALAEVVEAVAADPAKGKVGFRVTNTWKGQTKSEAVVEGYTIGGERVDRKFAMQIGEPFELLGQNTAPNPQEYLMAALNACIMVGYVAGASAKGITLESVEIETDGELDLRGFLGIDPSVKPGYEQLNYTVRIKGNGTPEDFREIHENVMRTSPNFFNVTHAIPVEATLEVV